MYSIHTYMSNIHVLHVLYTLYVRSSVGPVRVHRYPPGTRAESSRGVHQSD